MGILNYTTIRFTLYSVIVLLLHFSGLLSSIVFFLISALFVFMNYLIVYFKKDKSFNNKLLDFIWFPIVLFTIIFVFIN